MAVRYRYRRAGADDWSDPSRLGGIMRRVHRQQRRHGKPFRFRRRDQSWGRWFTGAFYFRLRLRRRLRFAKPRTIWQYQVGGIAGPVTAVLKYRVPPPELPIGERVIAASKECFGIPYGFGDANGPETPGTDSLDCSGHTQYAWGTVGVFLPHAARLQQVAGNVRIFHDERDCLPGDLVLQWFANSRGIPRGTASHVGLWLRPGFEIDTRSPSSPVAIRPIEPGSVVCYGRPIPPGQQR